MQTLNTVGISRQLLLPKLASAFCIVDATAGNGNDTLFLAQHSQKNACIYAFDVQEKALNETRQRLQAQGLLPKVSLFLAGHENLNKFVQGPIDIAMFNLGYLPGADHTVTTQPKTTLQAMEAVLSGLAVGGILSVTVYPGHSEGAEEQELLAAYFQRLSRSMFTALSCIMENHAGTAPRLYLIEKVRG